MLQSAFFLPVRADAVEKALEQMKEAARKTYFAKGPEVVERNIAAIQAGAEQVQILPVPSSWADAAPDPETEDPTLPAGGAGDPPSHQPPEGG